MGEAEARNRHQQHGRQEQRAEQRFEVGADTVLVVLGHGIDTQGRIENLGLEGAKILLAEPRQVEPGQRLEIAFRVRGLDFRLVAIVQRGDGKELGVRFETIPERRRADLSMLIAELEVLRGQPRTPPASPAAPPEEPAPESASDAARQSDLARQKERRAFPRIATDLTAAIYLVNLGSKMNGQLLNLSMGGCKIRTEKRFPVGIYTRIEAGFYHMGMPFRVAGVIQGIHAPDEVGIRFLDLSPRNREKIADLIHELKESRKK